MRAEGTQQHSGIDNPCKSYPSAATIAGHRAQDETIMKNSLLRCQGSKKITRPQKALEEALHCMRWKLEALRETAPHHNNEGYGHSGKMEKATRRSYPREPTATFLKPFSCSTHHGRELNANTYKELKKTYKELNN